MANSNITVTNNLRTSMGEEFINSFSNDQSSYYLYIGKMLPWANEPNLQIGDLETANTSYDYIKDVWFNMIAAKKIGGDSVRFVIPRNNWLANSTYTAWDDKSNTLYSDANSMYVITSNNDVYKCIANSNGATTLANSQPSGFTNNNGFIKTPDGYVWKYMYTVGSDDNLFLTNTYIPAPSLAVPNVDPDYLIPGTIDRIVIENHGSAYNTFNGNTSPGVNLPYVTIDGDGSGAVATCNVGTLDNVTGSVLSIDVVSMGSGYTYANVSVGGTSATGGGTGGVFRAIISPAKGHGWRPAAELGAKSVMVATRIGKPDATESGTFPVTANNSFRQFGILKNPYKYGNTSIANSNAVSQSVNIDVVPDATPNYALGSYVYQINTGGNTVFSGAIVDVVNNTVKCVRTRGNIVVGDTLYTTGSSATKKVSSYVYPAFEPYTGSILYIENTEKLTRNSGQAETFRVVFGF